MTVLDPIGANFVGRNACRSHIAEVTYLFLILNFLKEDIMLITVLINTKIIFIILDLHKNFNTKVVSVEKLATTKFPPKHRADPINKLRTSVLGAENASRLPRSSGAIMVHAATWDVYGEREHHPQPERHTGRVNPNWPRACHQRGKRAAETLSKFYDRKNATSINTLDAPYTHSSSMDTIYGSEIPICCATTLQHKPRSFLGSGTQTRGFCYVEGTKRAVRPLMESGPDLTGPYSIDNPDETTVGDLALMVKRITGSASPIVNRTALIDDPSRGRPYIRAANADPGSSPSIGLQEGLRRTIEDFRIRLGLVRVRVPA